MFLCHFVKKEIHLFMSKTSNKTDNALLYTDYSFRNAYTPHPTAPSQLQNAPLQNQLQPKSTNTTLAYSIVVHPLRQYVKATKRSSYATMQMALQSMALNDLLSKQTYPNSNLLRMHPKNHMHRLALACLVASTLPTHPIGQYHHLHSYMPSTMPHPPSHDAPDHACGKTASPSSSPKSQ